MRQKRDKESSKSGSKGIPRRQVVALAGALAASAATRAFSATIEDNRVKAAHRTFTISARPSPLKIEPARAAVLVVDMQNDFGAKGGMFDLAGIDISGIRNAIEPTARVLGTARAVGLPIVYLRMGFLPDLSDLGTPDSVNRVRHLQVMHVGKEVRAPDGSASRILIRDTWNTEILPELTPRKDDLVMYKTRFSERKARRPGGFNHAGAGLDQSRLGEESLARNGEAGNARKRPGLEVLDAVPPPAKGAITQKIRLALHRGAGSISTPSHPRFPYRLCTPTMRLVAEHHLFWA